jgi:hypothetical protein
MRTFKKLPPFTPARQPMICGSAEAENHIYKKIVDDNGCVWLYPVNNDHPGDNVYFHDPKDLKSQGFAGRVICFPLEDGTFYHAKGPWHSNSQSMKNHTNIDITDKHKTFGLVALKKDHKDKDNYSLFGTFDDIIYQDDQPQIGEYSRIQKLAQSLANELGIDVYYYTESLGGGSSGPVHPEKKGL